MLTRKKYFITKTSNGHSGWKAIRPGSQKACILENQFVSKFLAFRPSGIPAFELDGENR